MIFEPLWLFLFQFFQHFVSVSIEHSMECFVGCVIVMHFVVVNAPNQLIKLIANVNKQDEMPIEKREKHTKNTILVRIFFSMTQIDY